MNNKTDLLVQKNEVPIRATTTWLSLENAMFTERGQSQKVTYYIILLR